LIDSNITTARFTGAALPINDGVVEMVGGILKVNLARLADNKNSIIF